MPMAYTMKFIIMVCPTFFARVKPVSARAKPACMNITRKPATSVHTKLIATRLWPTKSASSSTVGLPAILAVTSPMPPVAVPAGSGFDGGGADTAAVGDGADVAAGGVAGLSWAKTQPPTARSAPTATAMAHARSARSDGVVSMPLMLGPFLESRCRRAASTERRQRCRLGALSRKTCAAPVHGPTLNNDDELARGAHERGCCTSGHRTVSAYFVGST